MSANMKSKLSAEWHNVLAGLQGLIFVAAALHGDLPNILSQFQSWIPMIASIIAYIHSKKVEASNAFSAGESANIVQVAEQAAPLLMGGSSDLAAIKAAGTQLITAIRTANAA